MHIGVCLNCRYIDLMENVGSAPNAGAVCPRCGTEMTSLGVRTDEWNALTARQKENLIREKCPTHDDLFRDEEIEEEQTSEEFAEEEATETVAETAAETARESVEEAAEEVHGAEEAEEDPGETVDIAELFGEAAVADDGSLPVGAGYETSQEEEREPDEFDIKRVYVCYKCNSVAGHDGTLERYFCSDCGSDMVGVGYTVRQWSELSKEEKRKVTEDAKVMHMVSEIKRDDYGDSGPEHTPSIINVVKDPKSAY